MSTPAIYALLFTLGAIVLWHPVAARRPELPRLLHLILRSGHLFLPAGLVFGLAMTSSPEAGTKIFEDLWPVIAFVAGWVGYAAGVQLGLDRQAAQTREASGAVVLRIAAHLAPSFVAGGLAGGATLAVSLAVGLPIDAALPMAFVAGAAGACSGAPLIAGLIGRAADPDEERHLRLVTTAARADDVVVCIFALAAFAVAPHSSGGPSVLWAVLLPLAGGVGLGLVAWLLLGAEAADDERLLLSIAVLGISAGFAVWLEVSPAVVCATVAATLVTLPGDRAASLRAPIEKLGRPAIVILMFATGMAIAPHLHWVMLAGGVGLVVTRAVAFDLTGRFLRRDLGREAHLLAAPGQLGLVVAFTFHHLVGGAISADVLGAVAVANFVDQLYTSHLVVRRVRRHVLTAEVG